MAIRWHMGSIDDRDQGVLQAFEQYPLSLMLHIADLQATFIDEGWRKMKDKLRFDELYIYEGDDDIGFFGWEGEELFVNLYVIFRC